MVFLGPTRLTGPTTLAARARAYSSRVVAVTFTLDGRPLGSDTTRPYELDVEPELLAPGRHRIRVVAVDSLGRRAGTEPKVVTVAPSGTKVMDVGPGPSFAGVMDALRGGNVTVRLAPGRYEVGELELGSGTRLVGSGAETVIAPAGDARYWALLVARGSRIRISDLTIDGGGGPADRLLEGRRDRRRRVRRLARRAAPAPSHPGRADRRRERLGSAFERLRPGLRDRGRGNRTRRRVHARLRRLAGYERDPHPDSRLPLATGSSSARRSSAGRGAALHGVALDNVISDVRDPARDACVTDARTTNGCGTNEGGIWTGGVEAAIIGNSIRRARWDGIETVGSSTRTTIVANEIRETRTGIYLEHSTNDSVISRNLIVDAETGINVEWLHDGVGSSRNTFTLNRVVRAESGLFVDVGKRSQPHRPQPLRRRSAAGDHAPGLVRERRPKTTSGAAAPATPLVGFESARWDSGALARSTRNRLSGNRSVRRC